MRTSATSVALLTFLAVIYTPVLGFLISGSSVYFQFFAADTFYYLTIADNTDWSNVASFDGTNPTNGFHPLWQFYLKTIFSIFDGVTRSQQISITFWLSVSFIALGASVIAYALKKTDTIRSTALLLIALIPGFLYPLLIMPNGNYGHLWSYINGMESPLSLFFFSLLFLLVLTRNKSLDRLSSGQYLLIGVCASFIVLTRLDDIFILAGLVFPILLSKQNFISKVKKCSLISIIPVTAICCYMVFNYDYAGTFLPTSGQAKGGLSLVENLFWILNVVVPVLPIYESGWNWWSDTSWRAMHMIAPLVIGVSYLFFSFLPKIRSSTSDELCRYDALIAGLAVYIVLKAFYNFFSVGVWHQGHWYYPLAILTSNIILAKYIDEFFESKALENLDLNLSSKFLTYFSVVLFLSCTATVSYIYFSVLPLYPEHNSLLSVLFLGLVTLGIVAFAASIFVSTRNFSMRLPTFSCFSIVVVLVFGNSLLNEKARTSYNERYEKLLKNGESIRPSLIGLSDEFRLLSFDDGIVSYSLQVPTMSGLGFALDEEAFAAKRQGELLSIAHSRGHKWLTSLNYMPSFEANVGDDVSDHLRQVFWLHTSELNEFTFNLVYQDPQTTLKIISFEPKR